VKQLALAVSEAAFAQQLHDHAAALAEDPKKAPKPAAGPAFEGLAAALALPAARDYDPAAAGQRKRKRLADAAHPSALAGSDDGGGASGDDGRSRVLRDGVQPPPPLPSFMHPNATRGGAYYRAGCPALACLAPPSAPPSAPPRAGADGAPRDPWAEFEAVPGRPPKPSHAIYDGTPRAAASAQAEGVAFACRARIGRGGRVVFDRTPLLSAGPLAGPGRGAVVGVIHAGRPRAAVAPALLPRGVRRRADRFDVRRLQRIYAASDSEDEELAPSNTALALAANTTLKYEICV
jgi:hypothetical protein